MEGFVNDTVLNLVLISNTYFFHFIDSHDL